MHEYLTSYKLIYSECMQCNKRTSYVCLKCNYCYSCHYKIEATERKSYIQNQNQHRASFVTYTRAKSYRELDQI